MPELVTKRVRISEGFALAALPVLGYGYAFAFQAGYLTQFGIPLWLVEVSLAHIAVVVALLLAVLIFLLNILEGLPRNRPWWALLFHVLVVAVPVVPLYLILRITHWNDRIEAVVGIMAIVTFGPLALLEFFRRLILPLMICEGSFLDRWNQQFLAIARIPRQDSQAAIVEAIDRAGWDASFYLFPAWVLLIVFPFLAFQAGRLRMRFQYEYVVLDQPRPCVAVAARESDIICVEIDEARRKAGKRFFLVSPSDARGEGFRVSRFFLTAECLSPTENSPSSNWH